MGFFKRKSTPVQKKYIDPEVQTSLVDAEAIIRKHKDKGRFLIANEISDPIDAKITNLVYIDNKLYFAATHFDNLVNNFDNFPTETWYYQVTTDRLSGFIGNRNYILSLLNDNSEQELDKVINLIPVEISYHTFPEQKLIRHIIGDKVIIDKIKQSR